MIKKDSSHGFSVAIGLLIVLILAALGFAGYFVWQKNKEDTKKPAASTSQNDQKKQEGDGNTKPVDPSEGGKYLVIKEWDVRFLLPEDLRGDVKYGIEAFSDKQTAWFEVGKIARLPGNKCELNDATEPGVSGKTGGIGTFLIRTPERILESETPHYYAPATNIRIATNWYTGGRLKGADSCVGGEANQQLVLDTAGSLTYALEGVEQIQGQ